MNVFMVMFPRAVGDNLLLGNQIARPEASPLHSWSFLFWRSAPGGIFASSISF
jgi:hypothetical protein